jgi:heat-inducible transcriptional repressor
VFVGGQSSLVDDVSLQREELARLLQLLEERETLARMLEEAVDGPEEGAPTVRIGEENPLADLHTTSLVAQRYRLVSSGSLGVLGPTRMDYGSALATVRAVSDELQRTLDALAEHG